MRGNGRGIGWYICRKATEWHNAGGTEWSGGEGEVGFTVGFGNRSTHRHGRDF
jgi:hypothetical protein